MEGWRDGGWRGNVDGKGGKEDKDVTNLDIQGKTLQE
jgi:hypothetical protein